MRTILSLALILGISGGVATLSGCDKNKTEHKSETKTTDKMPGGGEKETKTETKTTEKPGDNK